MVVDSTIMKTFFGSLATKRNLIRQLSVFVLATLIAFLAFQTTTNRPTAVLQKTSTALFPPDAPGTVHGPFSVSGNIIVDSTGSPVYLHGVDWPSLDWSCTGQWANSSQNGINPAEFQIMATQWGVNAVRIPVNENFWLSSSSSYCPNYRSTVAEVVHLVEQQGMIPIIDLHTGGPINTTTPKSGPECAPDSGSVTFWKQVANAYQTDPNVLFELYNEPHGIPWSIWRNGGDITCSSTGLAYHAVGMQQLLQAIRGAGAQNVVLADGIDFASNLTQVPEYALAGSNVAYVYHLYVNQSDPTTPSTWSAQLGSTTQLFPVVATEFGVLGCQTPYPSGTEQQILDFLTANGIGYTAWGWWAGGCGFPSLLSNESGACFDGGCQVQPENLALSNGTATAALPSEATSVAPQPQSTPVASTNAIYTNSEGPASDLVVRINVPNTVPKGSAVTATLASNGQTISTTSATLSPGDFTLPVSTGLYQFEPTTLSITVPTQATVAGIVPLAGTAGSLATMGATDPSCAASPTWGPVTVTASAWKLQATITGTGYPAFRIATQTCLPAGSTQTYVHLYYPGPSGVISVTPYGFTTNWSVRFGTSMWLTHGWNLVPMMATGSGPLPQEGLQVNNPEGWSGTLTIAKLYAIVS